MRDIDKKLMNLSAAFKDVAEAIRKEMPEIWAEAVVAWGCEENAVNMMCRKNAFLGGVKPVDLARESDEGREMVHTYIMQVKYGVYL